MSNTFTIKRGDSSPKLIYTLDPPVNLQNATAVFNMTPITADGADPITREVASIEDTSGVLGFAFTPAQTAVAGRYRAEFEVTYADSTIETFPNQGFIEVKIPGDLG